VSVGEKFGERLGELRDTRVDGEWYCSSGPFINILGTY
jgi:hypothetical protein